MTIPPDMYRPWPDSDQGPRVNVTEKWTNSTSDDDEESGHVSYAALPLVVLILWTFIGNAFVLIAVYRERTLKSMANYVIASLATADLLLSILVMPLSLYYLVSKTCFTFVPFPRILTLPPSVLIVFVRIDSFSQCFTTRCKLFRGRGLWGFVKAEGLQD